MSVRVHLSLLAGRSVGASDRESLDRLGGEIDAALEDIRTVTLEGAPLLLFQAGVPGALRSIAAHAPLPVVVDAPGFGRYETPVERGIYYCCLEALQNVVKHAGPAASARPGWRRNGAGSSSPSRIRAPASIPRMCARVTGC